MSVYLNKNINLVRKEGNIDSNTPKLVLRTNSLLGQLKRNKFFHICLIKETNWKMEEEYFVKCTSPKGERFSIFVMENEITVCWGFSVPIFQGCKTPTEAINYCLNF